MDEIHRYDFISASMPGNASGRFVEYIDYVSAIKEKDADKKAALEAQAEELEKALEKEIDIRTRVVESMRRQHGKALAAQAEEHETELGKQHELLLVDYESDIERLKSEHAAEISAKDEEFQDTYAALRQSRTSATERLRAELAALRGEPAPLYRKKPIEVEAIQFDGNNGWYIEQWSKREVFSSPVLEPTDDNPTGSYLQIKTLEGTMTADVGDWIIKGIQGEFYPCKPDIFEETYDDA